MTKREAIMLAVGLVVGAAAGVGGSYAYYKLKVEPGIKEGLEELNGYLDNKQNVIDELVAENDDMYRQLNRAGLGGPDADLKTARVVGEEKPSIEVFAKTHGYYIDEASKTASDYRQAKGLEPEAPDIGLTDEEYDDATEALLEDMGISEVEREPVDSAVKDPQLPYVISLEDYIDDNRFNKEHLNYLPWRNAVYDEDNDYVEMSIVGGRDILNKLAEKARDDDDATLYVRNEILGVDYEISYAVREYE